MAIETLIKKSLVIAMEEGVDEKGNPIIKRYSYSNVKVGTPSQNLLDAALAIASLCKGTVDEFNVVDTKLLA